MIELERTYLAKYLPQDLMKSQSKEMIDVYFPKDSAHPVLRLRKNGDKMELTKKTPINNDTSTLLEETIILDKYEFELLNQLEGKRIQKTRYLYDYQGITLEIDVFQGDLLGLVLVDAEFSSVEEKDNFVIPEFCLTEVTTQERIAGGMICGKTYSEIEPKLNNLGYIKL